ncbi:MAG: hypothetical protein DMG42_23640 [Acidobacteria bacterium]|nr:MAG: hypothetical protein AUH13_19200 [Acidobacteria bacterium 13_2_20CM_58_27]PYT68719.1 MAG: hypothetical protein DMG42_23640 [Acidobacteriota bacterium]
MRKRWIWLAPAAIAGIILFTFIGGELVMHLWNWLLPPLFGWRLITFWQALGLLLLCRILFGGWGGSGGGKGHMRHRMREGMAERMGERMRERWEKMTPEEREKFRQGLGGCWDCEAPADSKPMT